MDDKSITLELGDHRILDFKRNSKTRFFKDGAEVKSPKFAAGDQLSIEGPRDQVGEYLAVNVYWERSADASRSKDGTLDTWADDAPGNKSDDPDRPRLTRKPAPADTASAKENDTASAKDEEKAAETAPAPRAVEAAPRPAAPDPDDPGPPKLVRGRTADPARQQASNRVPPTAVAIPTPNPANGSRPIEEEDKAPPLPKTADLIRRAAAAAMDFTESLPAYVCQEVVTRYQSVSRPAKWEPLDVVTMNLVYENGKEDYRDIKIGGKPVKGKLEETGAWSTGEFGTVLANLFSPATAADFRFQKDSRAAGIMAKFYDFTVMRERSAWLIHMGGERYMPAYKGSVWIDPSTARVLRIEMQANSFPDDFPIDHVESATDYQYTRLGDAKQYLLPVHSETLSCHRGSDVCERNTIDFRNYHKYSGESTVTFGPAKEN